MYKRGMLYINTAQAAGPAGQHTTVGQSGRHLSKSESPICFFLSHNIIVKPRRRRL